MLDQGSYTIDPPGSVHTEADGLNDLGQIVGRFNDNTGGHGFLLDNGTYTTLDVWGQGINASSQIVGIGGLLDNGNYTPLNVPGFTYTWANGINASGQIVQLWQQWLNVEGGSQADREEKLIWLLEYVSTAQDAEGKNCGDDRKAECRRDHGNFVPNRE
jgi:probable HAF family extracellular repeat protein